jgi:hypothetical protein
MKKATEPNSQRVETEILRPASFSQESTLFLLPQKGILDGDLQLEICLQAADANQRMPLTTGVLGCIDTITMYYNNEVIQQTRNVTMKARMNNTFVEPEVRNQTHNTQIGAFDALEIRAGQPPDPAVNPNAHAGQYYLSSEVVGIDFETIVTGAGNPVNSNNVDRNPAFRINTNPNLTPEYRIKLKTLLPILGQISIPLGLLSGHFTIQIDWAKDEIGNRVVPTSNWAAAGETVNEFVAGNNIVQEKCQLLVDYIYYDEEPDKKSPMEAIAEQMASSGVNLTYTDYVNIDVSLPTGHVQPPAAVAPITFTSYLGLDHQVIRNITMACHRQVNTADTFYGGRMNEVYGKYESIAAQGKTELQLTCNNQPIFPIPLNRDNKIYQALCEVYDQPCKLNVGQTSWENMIDPANNNNFDPQNSFATCGTVGEENVFVFGRSWSFTYIGNPIVGPPRQYGKMGGANATEQYLGVNLAHTKENVPNAGLTIGRSPVTLRLTKDFTPNVWGSQQLVCWAEAERQMVIKNGTIFVSGS